MVVGRVRATRERGKVVQLQHVSADVVHGTASVYKCCFPESIAGAVVRDRAFDLSWVHSNAMSAHLL